MSWRSSPLVVAQACALGGVGASTGLAAVLVPQLTALGEATAVWRLGLSSLSVVLAVGLFFWARARLAPVLSLPAEDAARRTAANDFPFALARALFMAAAGLGASTTAFLWTVQGEPSGALVVGVVTYLLYVLPVLAAYLLTRSALRPYAAGPPGAGPVRGVRQSVALRLAFAVQLPVVVCSVGIVLVEQSDGAAYDLALEDYYRERFVRTANRLEAIVGGPGLGELARPTGVIRDPGQWAAVPAAMDRVRPLALRLPPILLLALITLGSAVLGRWLASEVTGGLDGVQRTLKELQAGDLDAAGRAAQHGEWPGLAELARLLRALGGALDGLQAQRTALRQAASRRLEAEHAKARFLAHVSHELKSPLHSILGFSEMLLAELYHPLTPAQQRRVQLVWRSGSSLLRFIVALLDLARLEVPLARGSARRPSGLAPAPVSGAALAAAIDQVLGEHDDPTGTVQMRFVDDRAGASGAALLDLPHTTRAVWLLCGPFLDAMDAGAVEVRLGQREGRLTLRIAPVDPQAEADEQARLLRQLASPGGSLPAAPDDRFSAASAVLLLVSWVFKAQGGRLTRQEVEGWPRFELEMPPA